MSQTMNNVQYIISISLCLQQMKPQQTHLKRVSLVEFKEFHLETDISLVRLFISSQNVFISYCRWQHADYTRRASFNPVGHLF